MLTNPDVHPARAEALAQDSLSSHALESAYSSLRSPFDAQPYLLIDLDAGTACAPAQLRRLSPWLEAQACPVIGIGGRTRGIGDACDLVLSDDSGLGGVIDNIVRAPLAAMTLVQVLRATTRMALARALSVESLAYSTLQAGPEFQRWSAANPPAPECIPTDDGPAVLVERRGDRLHLRLNRPSSRNAMSVEMRDALVEAFELAAIDNSIASVDVSALGACFSTGGALQEFGTAGDAASSHAVRSLRLPAATLLRCEAIVNVHVHGACIGSGIELPAFADRLTASPTSFFQLPEIRFGLIPGAGGCVSIPRRIGRQRTAYLALSARRINAATALDWGLVDEIVTTAD